MKWSFIKISGIVILAAFCFGFSQQRHFTRNSPGIRVIFEEGENRFVTPMEIEKILKSAQPDSTFNLNFYRENLRELELKLSKSKLVKNAEVFLGIRGKLEVKIEQHQPIARVFGENSYYIDKNGQKMPLSENFSARVPLVNNMSHKKVMTIFPLLKAIDQDPFWTTLITGIQLKAKDNIQLLLRNLSMEVQFGKIENVSRKLNNLKAFYKKMNQTNGFKRYRKINLSFENQVVATKK